MLGNIDSNDSTMIRCSTHEQHAAASAAAGYSEHANYDDDDDDGEVLVRTKNLDSNFNLSWTGFSSSSCCLITNGEGRSAVGRTSSELPDNTLYKALQQCHLGNWGLIRSLLRSSASERMAKHIETGRPIRGNRRRSRSETILHLACRRNSPPDVIESLLSLNAGACLLRDAHGNTPLDVACSCSSDRTILLLLDSCPEAAAPETFSVQSNNEFVHRMATTALHRAIVHRRSCHVIHKLLSIAPHMIHVTDASGKTPLQTFFEHETIIDDEEQCRVVQVCNILLQAAVQGRITSCYVEQQRRRRQLASSESSSSSSSSSLSSATWQVLHASIKENLCPWSIVELVPKFYPEQSTQCDKDGNFPLHLLCLVSNRTNNNEPCNIQLFDTFYQAHPASLVKRNKMGQTPLHLAAMYGGCVVEDGKIVSYMDQILKFDKQQASVTDRNGNLPLHLFCASPNPPLDKTTKTAGNDDDKHDDVLERLFQAYPEALMRKNNKGWTPFHVALMRPDLDVWEYGTATTGPQRNANDTCSGGGRTANAAECANSSMIQMNLIYHLLLKDPSAVSITAQSARW